MKHRFDRLPDVIFAQPDRMPAPEALGRHVVVLDIPFALPIAPSTHPLSHTETQQYYQTYLRETTLEFIGALGKRLLRWIDHHEHVAWRSFQHDERFRLVSASQAPACAVLVDATLFSDTALAEVDTVVCHGDLDGILSAARFLLGGALPYPDALGDAIAADTSRGLLSSYGQVVDRALKARRDDAICTAAVQWLIGRDKEAGKEVQAAARAYEVLDQIAAQLVTEHRDVGGCRIADARGCKTPFDLTKALCVLEEEDHIGIVIHGDSEREYISVGGRRDGLDLPRLLNLPGGSPYRVCLDAGHLPEVVAALDQRANALGACPSLPKRAMVEIVRRCNLRCPLCPAGNGRAKQLPDMNWDTFRHVVNTFGSSLETMTLHNYGEPLLHPQLVEFIRYAKASGVPFVDLSTNGNHLPERLAVELVASGLDAIRFSVDATEPQAYTLYRKGGQLERVLAHIESLAKARSAVRANTPHIEAQALLMRDNEASTADFERILLRTGADSVRWKTFNVFMSGETLGDVGKRFLPQNPNYRRYVDLDPVPASERDEIRLCNWPWDRLVVLADGTIVPCCHDYNGEYPLGMVAGSDVVSMWDTSARRAFMIRRVLTPTSIPMCRRCSGAVRDIGLRKEVTPEAPGERAS